jgi:hypothetical protein
VNPQPSPQRTPSNEPKVDPETPAAPINFAGVLFTAALFAGLYAVVWIAGRIWPPTDIPAPTGLEGVAKVEGGKSVIAKLGWSVRSHYDAFGELYDRGAFRDPASEAAYYPYPLKDTAFVSLYKLLTETPESADDDAFLAIMANAQSYLKRHPGSDSAKILRASASIHFMSLLRSACPLCAEKSVQDMAHKQTSAVFKSCLNSD